MPQRQAQARPGSLRSFAGGVASLLLTRAELLTLEAQELKDEIIASLFTGMLALILIAVGLMAGLLLIWTLTPPAQRAWALGACALLFCGAGALLGFRLRQRLRAQPAAFSVTLDEVRKDWAALGGGDAP
ncbi:hypothetical protein VI26_18235 [Chromobacterium sp. LK1]|uniref:phage holin family protein n=1 Tax=Chromobacterium sp. LK1 TaxID=1628193 RepID=UPI000652E575|nr:phage holin family protein [Chromobacterium sp. LK1]KMN32104.1 hypothetical protein VI26_18235 [Chromobacterium sp. LK1]